MTTPVGRGTLPWRGMEELPSEILNIVFDLLRQDKQSHWKLALLNRKFNAHFTPLLYRSVELFSYDQMHHFVRYASDRNSVSPARKTAVTQELLIAPPPRPCPYFPEAYQRNTSRAQLSPRQFSYLALGYDIETAAALGGGYSSLDTIPERDDPSMFGLSDIPGLLPEDAPKARVTIIPVRNDDRCFLVMSEVLRICPDVESLHFDIGTFEIYADEYRLPDDSFVDVDGVEKTRWNYLPQGLLPYLHCEGHRLIAAFGGLQRLKHFTWTHCQERNWTIKRWGSRQNWQAWFIYRRRMDVLTYGFDAMARGQASRGAHPLETIRLHTPSCEHWDKGVVPSYPTWYPSAYDRECYHQRLPVYVYDRWSREVRTKTFPQVVLGFGTHAEAQINRLNFPSLRQVTLFKPNNYLPPAKLASILCQNPSKAKLRVAAWDWAETKKHCRKAVLAGRAEHHMAYHLVKALQAQFERALALLPKDCGPARKRARLQRNRDVHNDDQVSTRPASKPIFRLFGHPKWDWLERSLARMCDGSDEDVKIRESLMMAAILEKLCRGTGRAGADDDSTTKTTPRTKKAPLHPPSKPLWCLLSRIYLAARPLPTTSGENSKARAELQWAVAKSLIETADEEARRDLQTVRFTFAGVPEATRSLAQLEECFKAMADVLAETMPVWLPGSQEAEAHHEASGRDSNSSCAVSSSWTDSQRLCGVELDQLRLPFGPSFIKRRLVRLAQASSQDAARDDRDYFMSVEECYNRKPAAAPLRCWLNLEELKLWDLDPMEAIVDLDDEDLDWTPAALKETLAAEGGQNGYDSDERIGRDFPPPVTYRPSTPEPEWVPQFYFGE